MIKPTVGRVVWVFNRAGRAKLVGTAGIQPEVGFITYVHDDRIINVGGFTALGQPYAVTLIALQDDDIPQSPAGEREGCWAEWMPYQKGQAAKTEAVLAERAAELGDLTLLSAREREIVGMYAKGLKTAGVATALALSVKTVDTHRARIRAKLGIHTPTGWSRMVLAVETENKEAARGAA